jgi:large subunit ribosomal protein L4
MNKAETYTAKGVKVEGMALPKEFSEKENDFLVAQAVRVYEENGHIGMRNTKTRAEINKTKKKWYKQKGTGGARHGAKSAPIFVGGGVAHGPRALRRYVSISDRLAKKALLVTFSMKAKAGEIVLVTGLSKIAKTKEAATLFNKIAGKKKGTLVVSDGNVAVTKFFKNLEGINVEQYKNMNAYKVIFGGIILLDNEIFDVKKTDVVKAEKAEVKKTVKKEIVK